MVQFNNSFNGWIQLGIWADLVICIEMKSLKSFKLEFLKNL